MNYNKIKKILKIETNLFFISILFFPLTIKCNQKQNNKSMLEGKDNRYGTSKEIEIKNSNNNIICNKKKKENTEKSKLLSDLIDEISNSNNIPENCLNRIDEYIIKPLKEETDFYEKIEKNKLIYQFEKLIYWINKYQPNNNKYKTIINTILNLNESNKYFYIKNNPKYAHYLDHIFKNDLEAIDKLFKKMFISSANRDYKQKSNILNYIIENYFDKNNSFMYGNGEKFSKLMHLIYIMKMHDILDKKLEQRIINIINKNEYWTWLRKYKKNDRILYYIIGEDIRNEIKNNNGYKLITTKGDVVNHYSFELKQSIAYKPFAIEFRAKYDHNGAMKNYLKEVYDIYNVISIKSDNTKDIISNLKKLKKDNFISLYIFSAHGFPVNMQYGNSIMNYIKSCNILDYPYIKNNFPKLKKLMKTKGKKNYNIWLNSCHTGSVCIPHAYYKSYGHKCTKSDNPLHCCTNLPLAMYFVPLLNKNGKVIAHNVTSCKKGLFVTKENNDIIFKYIHEKDTKLGTNIFTKTNNDDNFSFNDCQKKIESKIKSITKIVLSDGQTIEPLNYDKALSKYEANLFYILSLYSTRFYIPVIGILLVLFIIQKMVL